MAVVGKEVAIWDADKINGSLRLSQAFKLAYARAGAPVLASVEYSEIIAFVDQIDDAANENEKLQIYFECDYAVILDTCEKYLTQPIVQPPSGTKVDAAMERLLSLKRVGELGYYRPWIWCGVGYGHSVGSKVSAKKTVVSRETFFFKELPQVLESLGGEKLVHAFAPYLEGFLETKNQLKDSVLDQTSILAGMWQRIFYDARLGSVRTSIFPAIFEALWKLDAAIIVIPPVTTKEGSIFFRTLHDTFATSLLSKFACFKAMMKHERDYLSAKEYPVPLERKEPVTPYAKSMDESFDFFMREFTTEAHEQHYSTAFTRSLVPILGMIWLRYDKIIH